MQRWGQGKSEIDNEPKLRMPKDDVIRKVRDKIQAIDDLEVKTYDSMEFGMWHRETENLLRHAFGPKSRQVEGFSQICYTPRVVIRRNSYSHPLYLKGLQTARECLLAIVKEVEEFYNVATEQGITRERIFGLDRHLANVTQEMNSEIAQFAGINNNGCNS